MHMMDTDWLTDCPEDDITTIANKLFLMLMVLWLVLNKINLSIGDAYIYTDPLANRPSFWA